VNGFVCIYERRKKAIEGSGTVINNNYSLAYQAREQELVLL